MTAQPAPGFDRSMFTDPEDGMFDMSRYLSERPLGFLPVPTIITEPAVGFGLGLGAIFFHESEVQKQQRTGSLADGSPPLLPSDLSIGMGLATANGTWGAGAGHIGFWKEDHVRYSGFAGYTSLNLDFYSLDGIELDVPVELNIEGPALAQNLKFRLHDSSWFIGVNQVFRRVETGLANRDELVTWPLPLVAGQPDYIEAQFDRDVTTSGLGLNVLYDSVDNQFNPQAGFKWSAQMTWFDDAIGSDVDYTAVNLTSLNYWKLPARLLLGLRLQYDHVSASGDTRLPPYVPPYIELRGVPASRYQGEAVLVGEAQLGWQVSPRWTLSVFGGVGRASPGFSELGDADSITSRGAGFRYLLARRYGFAMGVDVARGPEETAYYIKAGSTWR